MRSRDPRRVTDAAFDAFDAKYHGFMRWVAAPVGTPPPMGEWPSSSSEEEELP